MLLLLPVVNLADFHLNDQTEIKAIVRRTKLPYCGNDQLSVTKILHSENFGLILATDVDIVDSSITNKTFLISEKKAIIKPIVKGNLDSQCLSSFRPVSNLTFVS